MQRIPKRTRSIAWGVALAMLSFAACSGDNGNGLGPDGDGDDSVGSFGATVSGDVSATLSGGAIQGEAPVDSETGQQGWVVVMAQDTETPAANSIAILRVAGRPAPGTYDLVDLGEGQGIEANEWGAVVFVGSELAAEFSGFSSSGTVTITSSSADRVEGTFQFEATGFDLTVSPPVESTVSVSGSFEAVNTPSIVPPL